ncbi:thiosulfate oxidation carrier protein SoxY [Profundibacterium mesophilum]|uniref:SoxY protein n=1 Tax=Profundibacterium mesophilum KAUST100406-0324 TaxID=1037889 RepID=A0A921NTJ7_9RHOB|nr:thiosulfate oxidation carrier protein SoxY [Profundibacterium mesophilum]KAF0675273.1 SoxY protein [Profundibacterium mesophilum KAUST100406-0324]
MSYSRRHTLAMIAGSGITVMLGARMALAKSAEEMIAAFTGGAQITGEGLTLTAPEIAENGNTVPVEVDAPGAEAIMILATGNPNPDVGVFHFGPLAGAQMASTRIRLAGTQEVVAIARMSDGSFARAAQEVKVTIGGCGG